ncbi:MAG: peptide chain release factor N(5)-glutamine methyltransferase [Kiritimatiellae bacterium]|nr:peptide chain release factor N(5)-glutamine methyltransferase [Kiritimatiellia bacterium]
MTTSDTTKTLGNILTLGADYLEKNGVENARVVCELLAERLLDRPRLELGLQFELVLNEKQLGAMRRGVSRVAAGEPVQYITGQTGFMGHTFKVDSRALIPRPETEGLVELILKDETLWKSDATTVVDIGTGSGCIVISLALAKPNAIYTGVDVSPDAMALAKENATQLGVANKINFTCAELADFIEPETISIIVANLPYIPTAEYEQLPVHIKDHEPRGALDGGPTGLDIVASIIDDATILLAPAGKLFLEIGEDQGEATKSLLSDAGFTNITVAKDLPGKDRYAIGSMASPH